MNYTNALARAIILAPMHPATLERVVKIRHQMRAWTGMSGLTTIVGIIMTAWSLAVQEGWVAATLGVITIVLGLLGLHSNDQVVSACDEYIAAYQQTLPTYPPRKTR